MSKALPIMIQGTSSDAGKSILVTALCRIFAQDGYRTAPFKSQNMALNSYITLDKKEIGRSQGVQAEAAGIEATTNMNPILLKPSRDNESQVVVHGKPYQNLSAEKYQSDFFHRREIIEKAYKHLASTYERIVIEGAGSPAEINLNEYELVNMRMARMADAPVILVADIDRGGVFANLVGTLQLLEPEDRHRVIGVVINKFRGDLTLLQSGLDWFETYTGKRVLGVLPYISNLHIEAEDSVTLDQYKQQNYTEKEIDIAVIRYPMIANFTDVDPFFVEEDCGVRFVRHDQEIGKPDLIILPGSKNTIEDLMFLEKSGLAEMIKHLYYTGETIVIGVCGGYQMLGEKVLDPHHVETTYSEAKGLGLIPLHTTLAQEKTTVRSKGHVYFNGEKIHVSGYEIHMGESQRLDHSSPFMQKKDSQEGFCTNRLMATYIHGVFHNDHFRHALLNYIRDQKGLSPMKKREFFNALREQSIDHLTDEVRKHIRLDVIEDKMKEFTK